MEEQQAPKAFLSYSHKDKELAVKIATDLRSNGVDIFIDDWEIQGGDSIIQKVFTQGIGNSQFFLILLSQESIKNKWVQDELDSAMIEKIKSRSIKIIPLLKEKCEIPVHLKPLQYISFTENYGSSVEKVVKSIFGVSDKPPLGQRPSSVSKLHHSIGGLSQNASTVGAVLMGSKDFVQRLDKPFGNEEIQKLVPFSDPEELNYAVSELDDAGLIVVHTYSGCGPYDFTAVQANYRLFHHFKEFLDYDPDTDILQVAAASVSHNKDYIQNTEVQEHTNLPPLRINRAVDFLYDQGYITPLRTGGTAPYDFQMLERNWKTKKFVQENS